METTTITVCLMNDDLDAAAVERGILAVDRRMGGLVCDWNASSVRAGTDADDDDDAVHALSWTVLTAAEARSRGLIPGESYVQSREGTDHRIGHLPEGASDVILAGYEGACR